MTNTVEDLPLIIEASLNDAVDHTGPDLVSKLADRDHNLVLGPAVHIVGDILRATGDDMRRAFEGNMMASFYDLQTLIGSLIDLGDGGQVLIGSSGTGAKVYPTALAYTSTKAGLEPRPNVHT